MIRRVLGTTLAGLCALTGPLASGTFASTSGATLTLSASSAQPGAAFTVQPSTGCPSASGLQTVNLTFTDHAGTKHVIGSVETEDDGSWAEAIATLPVAGLDADGTWLDQSVTAGAGTVSAACFLSADDDSEPGDDADDDADGDSGDDDADSDSDGDADSDDGGNFEPDSFSADNFSDDDADVATLTYASVAFTAVGSVGKLSLSAAIIKPGTSVTVTPSTGCAATGVSQVQISLIDLSGESAAPSTQSVTTSSTGTWPATTLAVPASSGTGDYAITASCSSGGVVTGSYDSEPVALGTVRIGAAVCGPRTVFTMLTGTYTGDIAGTEDVSLPSKLALTGAGPWTVNVHSASTGTQLATRTVACAKPQYEVDVPKTGLSNSDKPRARVCNTGRAPVAAILQVLKGKKYLKVDKETIAPGECVWLEGTKLGKGKQAKAQVRIDAPGTGSDEVTETFTVKRPRR